MKLNPAAERRLQQGLLTVAAILAIWTVAEILIGYSPETGAPAAGSVPSTSAVAPGSELPPLEDYSAIVERPLFFETRRPYEAARVAEVAPVRSEPAPELVLSAVIIADDRRIAIVEAGRNDVHRLVPGESVQGWTLTGIEAQRATFTRGSEILTLELTVPAAGGASNAPGREAPQPVPAEPEAAPPAGEAAPGSPQTGDNFPAS